IAWLQVFNSDLTPYVDPIPFTEGLVNRVHNFVVGEKKNHILTFHFDENLPEKSMVYLFDNKCRKLDSLVLPKQSQLDRHHVFRYDENEFLVVEGNYLTWVSANLEIVRKEILEVPSVSRPNLLLNSSDKKKQLVYTDYHRENLFILLDNFNYKISSSFDKPIKDFTEWNFMNDNRFYVLTDEAELQYQLSGNNLYYLKYPVYLSVYFASVLFIWLIQGVRTKQVRERYELQNQVRGLQLVSLRNQLDPHFIYNTFNSIASVIKQGRRDEAYDIFVLFSKMVRNNLDNSKEIHSTLENEMQFVNDYLIIQKFRFKDLFDFKIEKQPGIDLKIKIPKMLIQIHVENALKHGIRPKRSGGLLFIRLLNEQNQLRIEIEDNGVGRKKAGESSENGTGMGLKTINQIIDLSNHINKLKIEQEIIDLNDASGNPAGTKVIVSLCY
ncbi:MAG: sensor histidine kinase, partial [Prolixibacteraceae bacterium]